MAEENYNVEIESDPNNLITVEEFVNYFCKDINLTDDQLANVLLAVTEATTNAIIHANKCDQSKMVTIDVKVNETKLVVKIKDEGEGFDPADIPDPTEPENLLNESGRGVYLMRVYMDNVEYNRTPSGMEIILTLNL
ncbi:MAG: ATP-binding protein [Bacteroidetes bacterium]|nr:ATP-binding protein [Bacteroidota bacterium]MCH7772228.1 ATP-binding protein [Bacteroidota bacterium]